MMYTYPNVMLMALVVEAEFIIISRPIKKLKINTFIHTAKNALQFNCLLQK